MTPLLRAALALAISCSLPCAAQEGPRTLERITVQAARLERVDAFDTPASLDTIDLREETATAGVNLSERLGAIPGLLARDRQNYAQDTQLSIRGFGARATFGVRGVRLYADGIPATMPDGQGQLSHFNLMAGERVEILRGPFSALYGNSSGGVVQLFSADGEAPGEVGMNASLGSHASRQWAARLRGKQGRVAYHLAAGAFDTEGYRQHSTARRESANAKITIDLPAAGRLDLILNHLDLPQAQDPLGLTRTQWRADPRQATPMALQFDTRKTVRQDQLGVVLDQPVGAGQRLRATVHAGQREVTQFLSLPVAAQGNPLNSGGVIDLDNAYGGLDLRGSWQGELAGRPFEATAGANTEAQRQHRRGYENFAGDALGVHGALRRDERNRVENVDQYAQAWWRFARRWSLLAGVRHSEVRFRSRDAYVTAGNPDDSGRLRFAETTPVAGLMFDAGDDWRFHLSMGRGFETPTFNELAYRADGDAGLAFDLRPAISRQWELGGKWRSARGASVEAALFRADTDDELSVAGNLAGRSTYRNVGRARRQGVEASAGLPLGEAWRLQLAYTWLDAEFRDAFLTCARSGCAQPDSPVAAGTRIPGTARQQFFGRLQWRRGDWSTAAEAVGIGAVNVNDTATEAAPGYALLHLEASRRWRWGDGDAPLRMFLRIDNLLDKRYAGSVIVNEGNGRYYEPGPDRTFWLGIQWQANASFRP